MHEFFNKSLDKNIKQCYISTRRIRVATDGELECKMSISERKKKILGALVDEYIKTAEPV